MRVRRLTLLLLLVCLSTPRPSFAVAPTADGGAIQTPDNNATLRDMQVRGEDPAPTEQPRTAPQARRPAKITNPQVQYGDIIIHETP